MQQQILLQALAVAQLHLLQPAIMLRRRLHISPGITQSQLAAIRQIMVNLRINAFRTCAFAALPVPNASANANTTNDFFISYSFTKLLKNGEHIRHII